MRLEEEREIDGILYEVRMLDPDTAIDVLLDVVSMVGPSLAALFDGGDQTPSDHFMQGAIQALVTNADKAKVKATIKALASVSAYAESGDQHKRVPLTEAGYRLHFKGRFGTLIKWLAFALEVQFRDFGSAFENIPGLGTVLRRFEGTSKERPEENL